MPRQASTKKHASIVKKIPPTILVTGGTGFLGAHLVRQLVESGAKDIRVMATSIPEWLTGLGVDTIEGSVTNADDVARAVEDIQEIYHLAGRVSRDRDDAREMYKLHVEGARLLCDAAKKAGVKTIVMSSSSGTIAVTEKGDITPDETYPPPLDIIARWPYYASKAYQEMAALERFNGQGLRLVILNPSLLLGPGDDRLSSTKVVLDFMASPGIYRGNEERPARPTLFAWRGKLDIREIFRSVGEIDEGVIATPRSSHQIYGDRRAGDRFSLSPVESDFAAASRRDRDGRVFLVPESRQSSPRTGICAAGSRRHA